MLITGRNRERGEEARQRIAEESNNPTVDLVIGDLSSLAGIDNLAEEVLKRTSRLDVLVNNAGY